MSNTHSAPLRREGAGKTKSRTAQKFGPRQVTGVTRANLVADRRGTLREEIGVLTDQDMVRLRRSVMLVFGFAGD